MNKNIKRTVPVILFIILILIIVFAFINKSWQEGSPNGFSDNYPVKNVIMMVPDGCSISLQTLARWKNTRVEWDCCLRSCNRESIYPGGRCPLNRKTEGINTLQCRCVNV